MALFRLCCILNQDSLDKELLKVMDFEGKTRYVHFNDGLYYLSDNQYRVLPFEKQDRIHPHGYLKVQINERPEYIAMNASKRIWYASDSIWIN